MNYLLVNYSSYWFNNSGLKYFNNKIKIIELLMNLLRFEYLVLFVTFHLFKLIIYIIMYFAAHC